MWSAGRKKGLPHHCCFQYHEQLGRTRMWVSGTWLPNGCLLSLLGSLAKQPGPVEGSGPLWNFRP